MNRIAIAITLCLLSNSAMTEENWIEHARSEVGSNPTGWSHKWCAKFASDTLRKSGKRGCPGNTALSCLQAGSRIPGPRPGAIAVMRGHVGFVVSSSGNSVQVISGNHSGHSGHRAVGIGNYSKARVIAYIWPE